MALAALVNVFVKVRVLLYRAVERDYIARVFSGHEVLTEWINGHRDSDKGTDRTSDGH